MDVYLFDNFNSPPAEKVTGEPSEILDIFGDEAACPSVLCPTEEDKLAGSGFVVAQYKEGARSRKGSELSPTSTVQILVFDVDDVTIDQLAESWPVMSSFDSVLYSTWKHSADAPRLRYMLALDKPISNVDKRYFESVYAFVAKELKLPYDKNATDRVRFFLGPQHKVEGQQERYRFKGPPFPISEASVAALSAATKDETEGNDFEVTGDRPKKQGIKNLAKKLRNSLRPDHKKIATAIEAILRGEPYAPEHSRHNTTLKVTMALVQKWPQLDADWFASEYLVDKCWVDMWRGEEKEALTDWLGCVNGARDRIAESESRAAAMAKVLERATKSVPLTDLAEQLGKLILAHGNSFYVWSLDHKIYTGPWIGVVLPTVVRNQLGAVDGVQEYKITKQGHTLKSAGELVHEYGTTVKDVIWYPDEPPAVYDEGTETLYMKAYNWVNWEPKYHQIAEELLCAVAGSRIEDLKAYLYKFRDLTQPLPALTLVGGPGVWKSRIMEILGRCWTDKDVSHTNRAEHALARFNTCLLRNPTCWSDEQLVKLNGKDQPELYRNSITARVQFIEPKGLPIVPLKCAIRHLVSVNRDTHVFSSEVDADSITATMERFLLINVDEPAVAAFEAKWRGTEELNVLREGQSLLEHIRFIEENSAYKSGGRLFVAPKVDMSMLMRSRFRNDMMNYLWQIALDALEQETRFSVKGNLTRLPLVVDDEGRLRVSPGRLHALWATSKVVAGNGLKRPTTQKIGHLLTQAGFKKYRDERATKAPTGGWEVNLNTFRDFIEVSEVMSWDDFCSACENVFGQGPK
jgi:hypothetical protein